MALMDLQGMTTEEHGGKGGSNLSVTACNGASSLSLLVCSSI